MMQPPTFTDAIDALHRYREALELELEHVAQALTLLAPQPELDLDPVTPIDAYVPERIPDAAIAEHDRSASVDDEDAGKVECEHCYELFAPNGIGPHRVACRRKHRLAS